MIALIVLLVVAFLVLVLLARTIRIVPQARAGVIERLGRYSRTLNPGLAIVVPFVDRDGRFPDHPDRLTDLRALPAALGLMRQSS